MRMTAATNQVSVKKLPFYGELADVDRDMDGREKPTYEPTHTTPQDARTAVTNPNPNPPFSLLCHHDQHSD